VLRQVGSFWDDQDVVGLVQTVLFLGWLLGCSVLFQRV
jgi:hypothetical protein